MKRIGLVSLTVQTGGLLAAATLLALAVNAVSPVGIAVARPLALHELDARYLTAEETKTLYDAGQSIFLDARPEELFQRGHIAGAQSFPVHQFDDRFATIGSWLPKEAELVVYCDGKNCALSRQLADKLAAVGYGLIAIFHDGWSGWQQRGWPKES